jgi:glycine/D-amino acid oxidase-like deaminating enzyme
MPRPDVLIVGQGLAGTLLAWELQRAGIRFAIADPGHGAAASMAAAGIVNPITGQRFVKSWRIDSLLPAARATYAALEQHLGVQLWTDMRMCRKFRSTAERERAIARYLSGKLAPYAAEPHDDGFEIRCCARVDVARLLEAARARWTATGQLLATAVEPSAELTRYATVIDCRGFATTRSAEFSFVPWEWSRGEILEVAAADLDPSLILNGGIWILPVASRRAWIGATHVPNGRDEEALISARLELTRAAAELLERPFEILRRFGGVRVNLADKRPVAGRHPGQPRLGLISALGAKGVLWAPFLAKSWAHHVAEKVPFDPEIDVARFAALPP